jgi:hypothetical protein
MQNVIRRARERERISKAEDIERTISRHILTL